jgi:hypothetical protein
MNFEEQLNALIFFHLKEHTWARELVQVLKEDDFAQVCYRTGRGHQQKFIFRSNK